MTPASKPASDWQELMRIAQGASLVVERVRIPEKQIAVEGEFTLPQLARLTLEDQVFIIAFLRSHGSIKEMEQIFGVSYPTIKSRLNRIAQSLEFVDTNPTPSRADVLDRLKRGEINAQEAIAALREMGMKPSRPFATLEEACAKFRTNPRQNNARPEILQHVARLSFRQDAAGGWVHKMDRRTLRREPIQLDGELERIRCPALLI